MDEKPTAPAGTSTLTVLIADKFEKVGLDRLRELGCDVRFEPGLTAADLPAAMKQIDPDVLVVRSTKVTEEVFAAADKLSLVIRAGAGYDNIDADAASDRGIFVCNCPGMNSTAVAELVMGLILSVDRRIPDQAADLHAHKWDKKGYSKARGLKGRTLGIIGMGKIGQFVAQRALAFEMYVLYYDLVPCAALDRNENVRRVDLEEVLRNADFVTLHVPATENTKNMINGRTLGLMKPDAVLINTARGSVVDEQALVQALKDGTIAAAAMDVYPNEPAAGDTEIASELTDLPNFIGTHHVGASTDQAQAMVAAEVCRIVGEFRKTGDAPNCVNLARTSPATCVLTARYRNDTGVLAHIFQILSRCGINTEEMSNVVYSGATAGCVRIQLDTRPTTDQLATLRNHEKILSVAVTPVGA